MNDQAKSESVTSSTSAARNSDERPGLDGALQRAKERGTRVLLIFGADWCPDCHALDAALLDPLLAPLVEKAFEVVSLDVGRRDRHLGWLEELGMDVWKGIPAVAVLDASGKALYVQKNGEFGRARQMSIVEFVRAFSRWTEA